jgi:predicted NBD/HSP70 family sugar kinase
VDEPTLARLLRETRTTDALEEVARQRRILATALANAINVLNPSVVVLGGFLGMLAEHDLVGFTAAVVAQSMPANGEDVEIRPAALAEDRLMIGAAEAAFEELLRDPAGTALH